MRLQRAIRVPEISLELIVLFRNTIGLVGAPFHRLLLAEGCFPVKRVDAIESEKRIDKARRREICPSRFPGLLDRVVETGCGLVKCVEFSNFDLEIHAASKRGIT